MFGFSQRRWATLAILCGLAACSPVAFAQDIGDLLNSDGEESAQAAPPSPVDLLERDSVIQELQLDNAQREQIKTIIADFRKQADEIQKSSDERLKAMTSLGDRIRKRAEFRNEVRAQTEQLKTKAEQSLLELLSDQQKESLKKKLPEPAAAPAASTSSGSAQQPGGGPAASTTASSGSSPAAVSTPRPSTTTAKRTANTVASFAAIDDEIVLVPSDVTAPGVIPGGTKPAPAAAEKPPEKMSFNFVEAPWSDVLRLFAKSAGLTLNVRDQPPGSFTYFDRGQYTPREALDIMNRVLLLDGYIMVRHDRFLSVFNTSKGVPPNLVETVPASELEERGETELVRVSLPLGDREAAKAAEEIRQLLGPQGKVVPLVSANAIVVTDVVANLIKVRDLLKDERQVEKQELIFKAFPLTKIDAAEAADIIKNLLGVQAGVTNVSAAGSNNSGGSNRGGRGGRGGFDPREFFSRMRGGGDDGGGNGDSTPAAAAPTQTTATAQSKVAVDVRTNSVLINATAASMKLVEQMVEAIDIEPTDIDGLNRTRSAREPFLEVYKLKEADASEVAKTLGVLHPGMVVNEDGRNKMLHIWATADKHKQIAAHIRQLDGLGGGDTLAVLPLEGLNGYDVSTTVAALYKNDAENAPSVQFDPSGRNVIVRGDVHQIQMVQNMIEQLAAQGPYESQGRSVQIVGSSTASSTFIQQTVPILYPQVSFVGAPAAAADTSSRRTSRDSQSGRNSGDTSTNGDSEREQRIQQWRERFFGGFGRGGDSSGSSGSDSNSRGGGGGRSRFGGSGRGR